MNKEGLKIYSSILQSGWMATPIKMSMKMTRKDFLLLSLFIDKGLASEEAKALLGQEDPAALKTLSATLLENADLKDDLVSTLKEFVAAK
jgi:hypothetical protein